MTGYTYVAVALLFAACSPDAHEPDAVVVRDSAGVQITEYGGVDRPLDWQIEVERRLGGEDGGPLSFYRLRPGLIAADDDGRIFVLDAINHRVVALDAEGTVLWVGGRRGGGPGELEGPNSLMIEASGAVAVHDTRKAALVRFAAADGAVLPQEPFAAGLFRAWLPHVHATTDGYAILVREPFSGSDDRAIRLLRTVGQDTMQHFARTMHISSTAQYDGCGMTLTMPIPFAPMIRWAVHEGSIAAVSGAEYAIDIFTADGSSRSLRRSVQPVPVTREEVLAVFAEQPGTGPLAACAMTPAVRVERHGYATSRQIVNGLVYDRDGRLWVQRDSARGPIDIFDTDGGYTGTIPPGSALPLVFLPDGRTGHSERDELDVDRLVIVR